MNTASPTSPTRASRAGRFAAPTAAIDPLCGMRVQADKAVARVEFDGKPYLFCSADCQHKFKRAKLDCDAVP